MNKYPYTYNEFETEVKKQYLKDYCNNNKKYMEEIFELEDLDKVIQNNYNSCKVEYEKGERPLQENLKQEVRSVVACLGMF